MTETSQPRVAIIGGGITGIAAALKLRQLLPQAKLTLFEKESQLGGVLQTDRTHAGWLVERSADMFTTVEPEARGLAERIGYADELVPTQPTAQQALIVHRGKLVAVPVGLSLLAPARVWPLLSTPLLSIGGKARLAWEPFVRRRKSEDDESLADFSRRRLGREAFNRLIQPLVGGIYTADPEKLSMQATLRRFVEMEQTSGSLFAGARKASSKSDRSAGGARYSAFLAPKQGMGHFVQVLAGKLPADCVVHTEVHSLVALSNGESARGATAGLSSSAPAANDLPTSSPPRYQLTTSAGEFTFDAVLITAPSTAAASLLTELDPKLSSSLREIEYAGTSVVVLGIDRSQAKHPLDCYGFVVPAIENRRIIAASFASNKFPGRAPDHSVLIRAFVGGALQPELADLEDSELISLVLSELGELIGMTGEPRFAEVVRWTQAMPQYHVGHLQRVATIESLVAQHDGLELAGKSYRGVGIPLCIRDGERAAASLASQLLARSTNEF